MAANTPQLRLPSFNIPPTHRQLTGALAPATAFTNAQAISEVVVVAGSRYLTVRCLTATAGGTLSVQFLRPVATTDAYALTTGAVGSIDPTKVTPYGTGNPATVAVTAGTEAILTATCNGEWYALVTFTGGGSGTLTWLDISQV